MSQSQVSKKKLKQLRNQWFQLTQQKTCCEYQEFAELCQILKSVVSPTTFPLDFCIRAASFSFWSNYPQVVTLLQEYLSLPSAPQQVATSVTSKQFADKKIRLVNVYNIGVNHFVENFLANIKKLGIVFKTPLKVVHKRERKLKRKELRKSAFRALRAEEKQKKRKGEEHGQTQDTKYEAAEKDEVEAKDEVEEQRADLAANLELLSLDDGDEYVYDNTTTGRSFENVDLLNFIDMSMSLSDTDTEIETDYYLV